MAGRVNQKLQHDNSITSNSSSGASAAAGGGGAASTSGDAGSVDLDNLFSFLTEIPTEKSFLDDINQEMTLLADDVQGEVRSMVAFSLVELFSFV